jgi:hypothetical protein
VQTGQQRRHAQNRRGVEQRALHPSRRTGQVHKRGKRLASATAGSAPLSENSERAEHAMAFRHAEHRSNSSLNGRTACCCTLGEQSSSRPLLAEIAHAASSTLHEKLISLRGMTADCDSLDGVRDARQQFHAPIR